MSIGEVLTSLIVVIDLNTRALLLRIPWHAPAPGHWLVLQLPSPFGIDLQLRIASVSAGSYNRLPFGTLSLPHPWEHLHLILVYL